MLRAVEFLTEHQSPIHLNVTLVPILPAHENRSRHRVNLDPADKPPVTIKRARHALSAFTATNPHYGLDAALLVPSIRSSSKDLDGRLHIHALLAVSGFVPLVHLAAVAEVFGLHVNWLADRHEVQRTPLDYGRVLSYNLEQVMTDPTDFGRKPRVQTWKPTAKLHRYATSRKLHAALSDANRRGAAAARAEASKRFARGR